MTVYGLYCQWFRYFSDRMKCTQVAKVKLSVLILLFKQYGSQSQNMVFFYSVDHKRYYWYESEDPPPRFWTKVVSIEKKTAKIRLCTKRVQFASKKVKIKEIISFCSLSLT